MKLLTQTIVLATALGLSASAFAQSTISPASATRQRKATTEGVPQTAPQTPADVKPNSDPVITNNATPAVTTEAATDKDPGKALAAPVTTVDQASKDGPFSEPTPAPATAGTKKDDKAKTKDSSKQLGEVTADAQTNRRDQAAEEEAIVPYYNNFFTTYRLGPEDVVSVTVFGQDRYSKGNIKIPPSGRISLALIPDGIFVNGKTVDQVAELIKKRYDEYIIDPQVSVSLDQAGSYRYSVIGDVAQPGIKLMSRRLSVTEALSEAGGVLQTGNRSKVFVLRRQANGVLTPIPVNVSAIYKGQAPDSVYLVPGDQVVVPGNTLKKLQTIMGFTQVLTFARLFTGGF
ncbi:MAG: polysaccharide biosynthesis/export protein [Blastocatellia bacterium]|jgi:polysaccharide export outer membrane protein|nr:polysaccharide biosynthesis/export protein [Blastocatellia bacterium]